MCRVEHLRGAQIKTSVEDEGEGFDYTDLDLSIPEDPRKIKRRGLILINACSEKIEFNRPGNLVTAIWLQLLSIWTTMHPRFPALKPDGRSSAGKKQLHLPFLCGVRKRISRVIYGIK